MATALVVLGFVCLWVALRCDRPRGPYDFQAALGDASALLLIAALLTLLLVLAVV